MCQYLADHLAQLLVLGVAQRAHVRRLHRIALLALGADVLVDALRLRLHDAHAATVEPVLAFVAADVELGLVVRFAAQAVKLLRVARVPALAAHELRQRLRRLLGDADALAVEPVVAQVAAHVELGVVVRRAAQAEEFLLVVGRVAVARRRRGVSRTGRMVAMVGGGGALASGALVRCGTAAAAAAGRVFVGSDGGLVSGNGSVGGRVGEKKFNKLSRFCCTRRT